MQAVAILSASRSSALPHLRTLNGHVASSISSSTAGGQLAPVLPRQDAPAPVVRDADVMGVSSFAFQVSPLAPEVLTPVHLVAARANRGAMRQYHSARNVSRWTTYNAGGRAHMEDGVHMLGMLYLQGAC